MTQPYRGRTVVEIAHPSQDISWRSNTNLAEVAGRLHAGINAGATGIYADTVVTVSQGGTQAYGTVTMAGVGGTAASGTVALSGVGGTAASGTATYSSASGTTSVTVGYSPGVAFSQSSGTDAERATALKDAINASTDSKVQGVVTASDNGAGVCTITAVHKGTAGNAIVLTGTGTGLTVSGSGTLTSGAQGSVAITVDATTVTTNTTDLSDTAAATACAAAIEANTTLGPEVVAVGSTTNVSITWGVKGTVGNSIALSATTATGTATASDTALTGGSAGAVTLTVAGTAVATTTTTMTDTAAAAACAAAVNANSTVNKYVSAAASGDVVTVTALDHNDGGNLITLTTSTTTGTAATGHLSGGKLSGGATATSFILRRP